MADGDFTAETGTDILLCSNSRAILRTAGTPILTVYATTKWYALVLVKAVLPGGRLDFEEVYYDELEKGFNFDRGSAFVDHDPNPDAVRALADKRLWAIDDLAEEIIEGRWAMASRPTRDITP